MGRGHRGANHPVKDLTTGKIEITSQNHGFAVDQASLPDALEVTHVSLFDGSVRVCATVICPSFGPIPPRILTGPHDSRYLFDRFTTMVKENKMPRRDDIASIMIIGAGPIIIGQACEFDYSGAQACKALREEGYRIILVNSNPATIMTDPGMADATYRTDHPKLLPVLLKRKNLMPCADHGRAGNAARHWRWRVASSHVLVSSRCINPAIEKAEDRELPQGHGQDRSWPALASRQHI